MHVKNHQKHTKQPENRIDQTVQYLCAAMEELEFNFCLGNYGDFLPRNRHFSDVCPMKVFLGHKKLRGQKS